MYRRLRDMREDADKTQAELAAVLNVGQTTYSRYENGVLDIPSIALIALARYYQVSTDYLLGLTDERKPYPPGKKMTETPPQSGSGRKEQTKSKAAPNIAGSILHSACSRPIVRLSMAGLRGRGPSCVFRPLLHIQKRSLRSTGVLCPALLSAKSGGILRRRE